MARDMKGQDDFRRFMSTPRPGAQPAAAQKKGMPPPKKKSTKKPGASYVRMQAEKAERDGKEKVTTRDRAAERRTDANEDYAPGDVDAANQKHAELPPTEMVLSHRALRH